MTVYTKKEPLGIQNEVQQRFDLRSHAVYSNQEIFLRELISNASDAADRLRFEGLQDDSLFEDDPELKIRVEYNKTQKTITVLDNGIGMSRQEVVDNLGTIAKSGSRQFFESLTGDQTKDSQLIGQFGVGFYSSFIVAEKVEVFSRRAGLAREEGAHWVSDGKSEYTVETVDRPKRGTKVILYLRKEAKDFLDGYRLRSIISKYSDHISLPIVMPKEGKDEKGEDTVNTAKALWTRNKKDIKDEEYNEFYKTVSHDFEDPLCHVHNKVEGKLEYTSLLFIPARAPFDLWDREQRHGVKLYVKRVFIMDDAKQLLPPYLRFVKGVVDSDDLPLNISREILQQNKVIETIRSASVKKILDLLKKLADKEPDKYKQFWQTFGRVMKEGVIDAPDKRENLAKLFRFKSTREDTEEETVSLDDYIAGMKEGQKAVYYVTAENYATAKNSPHLEIFRKKGIEVLLLTDPIDEWLVAHLAEYQEKPLTSVNKGELDLGDLADEKSEDESGDTDDEKLEGLTKRIEKVLDERVKEVRITRRLTASPACLVADEYGMGRHMEQILKASGQQMPMEKPILEINPDHPIVGKLQNEEDENRFGDWANILFEQALLSEGGQLEDPAGFVHRLNSIFLELK
ncbi:MAG: molecular chaperone HtpG [Gammaproteobacteria bacterium]|nr:molecular chaperone HtpG [Gammaproteobacteria bacterium]